MKQLAVLFSVLLMTFGFAQAQEIKVMTFNIFHGEHPTPSDSSKSNFDELIKLILEIQPDMIALQEVDSMTNRSEKIFGEKVDFMKKLSKETGYHSYFAKAMDFDYGAYGEGLLVKNKSDNLTLTLPNPAGGEPRAMAWAKIELSSKDKLYFGGTHLCHETDENRLAQIKEILAYTSSLDYPVFWVGDLNFAPDSPIYTTIPSPWKDAGLVAKNNSSTYDSPEGKRIDYIWYDSEKLELVDYEVIKINFSDHYPVVATLKLIQAAESN